MKQKGREISSGGESKKNWRHGLEKLITESLLLENLKDYLPKEVYTSMFKLSPEQKRIIADRMLFMQGQNKSTENIVEEIKKLIKAFWQFNLGTKAPERLEDSKLKIEIKTNLPEIKLDDFENFPKNKDKEQKPN